MTQTRQFTIQKPNVHKRFLRNMFLCHYLSEKLNKHDYGVNMVHFWAYFVLVFFCKKSLCVASLQPAIWKKVLPAKQLRNVCSLPFDSCDGIQIPLGVLSIIHMTFLALFQSPVFLNGSSIRLLDVRASRSGPHNLSSASESTTCD